MTDRPASWRMPSPKQMKKLASSAVRRNVPAARTPGPADEMPPEYWQAVLNDPLADGRPGTTGRSVQTLRLSEITQHILRVSCRRCGRTVEIQKADAVRLAGAKAVWKDFGQRLLDDTCQQRTGRHEEDGCWPSFE
jgi:hypothetical protein